MKVSIVVPVYNAEKYIAECFNSVANQTHKNIEAIFVDDCSSDDSYKILQRLAKQHSGIGNIQYKIIRHESNKNVSAARNTGIREATGEYISFIDSDDVIIPNCIEHLLNFAKKYPSAEIISGSHISIAEDDWNKLISANMTKQHWDRIYNLIIASNKVRDFKVKDFEEVVYKKNGCEIINFWLSHRVYEQIAFLAIWALLCKRSFIEENNIYFSQDLPNTQDVYFRYLCAKNATQLVLEHTPIYVYRSGHASLSRSDDQYQRISCWAICLEKMLLDLDKNSQCCTELARWLFSWTILWSDQMKSEKEKTLITRYLDIAKKISANLSAPIQPVNGLRERL